MNRALALGLTLVAPGLMLAADPPWTPPATVWTSAGNPVGKAVTQTPDVPAVPAPGTPPPLAPAPRAAPLPAVAPAPAPAQLSTLPAYPVTMPPMSSGTGSAAMMPLPGLLTGIMSTTPTIPADVCATADDCPPAARGGRPPFGTGLGPCVDRFKRWLSFQPGPPVLPTCVPEPYHAPVRTFFPCKPTHGGQPGCGTGGYGAGGYGVLGGSLGASGGLGANSGVVHGPPPTLADRFGMGTGAGCGSDGCPAPKHKGFGAFARPSQVGATTGEVACEVAPVGVPLPAGCVGSGYSGCYTGCDAKSSHGPVAQRLMSGLGGCRHGGCSSGGVVTGSVVPVVMGYTRPAVGGYRYADPLGIPGAGGRPGSQQGGAMIQEPVIAPIQHTAPAANRPFTNP